MVVSLGGEDGWFEAREWMVLGGERGYSALGLAHGICWKEEQVVRWMSKWFLVGEWRFLVGEEWLRNRTGAWGGSPKESKASGRGARTSKLVPLLTFHPPRS